MWKNSISLVRQNQLTQKEDQKLWNKWLSWKYLAKWAKYKQFFGSGELRLFGDLKRLVDSGGTVCQSLVSEKSDGELTPVWLTKVFEIIYNIWYYY